MTYCQPWHTGEKGASIVPWTPTYRLKKLSDPDGNLPLPPAPAYAVCVNGIPQILLTHSDVCPACQAAIEAQYQHYQHHVQNAQPAPVPPAPPAPSATPNAPTSDSVVARQAELQRLREENARMRAALTTVAQLDVRNMSVSDLAVLVEHANALLAEGDLRSAG